MEEGRQEKINSGPSSSPSYGTDASVDTHSKCPGICPELIVTYIKVRATGVRCISARGESLVDAKKKFCKQEAGRLAAPMDQTCISRKQQKILQADSFSWRRTLRLPKLRGTIVWPWFMLTLLSASVVVLHSLFDEHVQIPSEAAVTLGTVSGLLLAFRLQAAYNKWWEARCLWGDVIKISRILVSELLSNIEDAEASGRDGSVLETAAWCLLVAMTLKRHLRGGGAQQTEIGRHKDASKLIRQCAVGQAELEQARHPPLCAVYHLQRSIHKGLRTTVSKRRSSICQGVTSVYEVCLLKAALSGHTNGLIAAITAAERILTAPCPPGCVGVHRYVMMTWLILLPFSLVGALGWRTVPMVLAISFLTLAVEQVAVEIEQPFGNGHNGLPMQTYVRQVEADLTGLLDAHDGLRAPKKSSAEARPPQKQIYTRTNRTSNTFQSDYIQTDTQTDGEQSAPSTPHAHSHAHVHANEALREMRGEFEA